MIESINLSHIFVKDYDEFIEEHKNKSSISNSKFSSQDKFEELLKFTNNSCYWSRYNFNPISKCFDPNRISGKYLNEIFRFMVKNNFLSPLYSKFLDFYLKTTNFSSLDYISIDSCFIRNINGINLSHNPTYSNKPGLKIHVLVDANKVPISLCITDCNIHDSTILPTLFKNLLIAPDLLKNHSKYFLADSAYYSVPNINLVNSYGLTTIMGRNKHHLKNNKTIFEAADDANQEIKKIVKDYKKRVIVENFFADIQRTPIILNNYQKTFDSFQNLLLFVLIVKLSKKINKYIKKMNDEKHKELENLQALKKKEEAEIRRKNKLANKEKIKKEQELNKLKQIEENEKQIELIKNKIFKNVDLNKLRSSHKKSLKIYNKDKTKKRGRQKDVTYKKCKSLYRDHIYNYMIKEALTKTIKFKFRSKSAYLTKVDSNAFTDDRIKSIMDDIDFDDFVDDFVDDLFG